MPSPITSVRPRLALSNIDAFAEHAWLENLLMILISTTASITEVKEFLFDQSMVNLIKLIFATGCFITGCISIAIGLILHTVNIRLLEISNQLSKLV